MVFDDVLEELVFVVRIEGREAGHHLVEDNSKEVPVDSFAMTILLQHLGR